jgi:hypothetical protein
MLKGPHGLEDLGGPAHNQERGQENAHVHTVNILFRSLGNPVKGDAKPVDSLQACLSCRNDLLVSQENNQGLKAANTPISVSTFRFGLKKSGNEFFENSQQINRT